jgi:hypothetical protein
MSPLVIAAADEETNAMDAAEKRRVKRATSITQRMPTNISLRPRAESNAVSQQGDFSASPRFSPSSPPLDLASSSCPPSPYFSPAGAVSIARAETLVSEMTSRDRMRSRRMTQALHDGSYRVDKKSEEE